MNKLTRQNLMSLEQYAEKRADIRSEVLAHKQNRHIELGNHLRLLFEDRLTIQYQIQEMLRVERIFEAAGIQDELDAYNPLIPDGDNLKATLLIEYENVEERKQALENLRGIEDAIYARVGDAKVYAIADEDLERANDTKTASVHFLRFQFAKDRIARLRSGSTLHFGVEHPHYTVEIEAAPTQRSALLADFD